MKTLLLMKIFKTSQRIKISTTATMT